MGKPLKGVVRPLIRGLGRLFGPGLPRPETHPHQLSTVSLRHERWSKWICPIDFCPIDFAQHITQGGDLMNHLPNTVLVRCRPDHLDQPTVASYYVPTLNHEKPPSLLICFVMCIFPGPVYRNVPRSLAGLLIFLPTTLR